jgi:hypothetical protein
MVVKLPTQWTSKTKAGDDATGWKRGARGYDGLWDKDSRDFIGDKNPAASDLMYGRRGDRPNGQQRVQTGSRDPGYIINDGDKGYRGVDE